MVKSNILKLECQDDSFEIVPKEENMQIIQKIQLIGGIRLVQSKEKEFECVHCPKKFSNNYQLKSHEMTVHLGKKDFECKKCETTFGQKSNLKTHINTVHRGAKNFKCMECQKKFTAKENLKKTYWNSSSRKKRLWLQWMWQEVWSQG